MSDIYGRTPVRMLAAAILTTLIAFLPVPAAAQSIKVIVDDTAITSMDIQSRAKLLQIANRMGAGASQKAATEELIDEALRLKEAARRGVTIPDAAVDKAIADIAGRSNMTPKQFAQALGQAGVNIKTLRERLRTQMAWGRIVRARLQQTMKSEQDDLIAQMRRQETAAETVTAEDFVLQRVVFTLPGKPSKADVSRRRQEAEALRGRFASCEQGLALAKGLKEVAVINIGRKLASEVTPQIRETIGDTKAGNLTKPEVTPLGIEMLAVCDRIPVRGESAAGFGIDTEAMNAQGQEISDTLTRELRQKANIVYR